jgi:hypothetical protein
MPALGLTVDEATIDADIKAMSPGEARRAYGNVWVDDEALEGWRVIDAGTWAGARLS